MAARVGRRNPKDVMRCSFCNKSQFEIRRMVAGPHAIICDECVQVCVEILGQNPSPQPAPDSVGALTWPNEVHCSLCRKEVPDEQVVPVRGCGLICGSCLGKIRGATEKRVKR